MLGLSRAELAKRAGLAPSCIQAFEEGWVATQPATLARIARALENAGCIINADGSMTTARRVLAHHATLRNPTAAQTAQAIIAAGIVRRSGR